MKSKAKGKMTKPKGLVSDGSASPNVSAPSVTGAFMQLAHQGKLQRVTELMAKYSNLSAELSEIEESLKKCHDPIWLKEFSKQVGRQGRSFQTALPKHTLLSKLAENSARQSRKHRTIHPLAACAEGRLATPKCRC